MQIVHTIYNKYEKIKTKQKIDWSLICKTISQQLTKQTDFKRDIEIVIFIWNGYGGALQVDNKEMEQEKWL